MIHQVKYQIRGEDLILEVGRMAKQANGAVFAQYGGSAVLATACCSESEVKGIDFIPLQVEYNEKYYAAGKIPGGFIKRESRPRDKEILVSRLIDRPMRPLFYKEFAHEIQVIPTTIATDLVNPPNVLGMIASFAAVHISDIPFNGPVGAVSVAYLDNEFIINPSFDQIDASDLDIIVAGTIKGITMVEGGANEVSEEIMIEAIKTAHKTIIDLCKLQEELREKAGKPKIPFKESEEELENKEEVINWIIPKLKTACFEQGKQNRRIAIKKVKEETIKKFEDKIEEEKLPFINTIFENLESEVVRQSILEKGLRTDGRGPDDIRPISCEIDVLPRTHGSALFTRGETQALSITTLGTVEDEQILDNIDEDTRKNFMLHYNFPPFSVGETGRLGTGRREIGHGNLAERAIKQMLPTKEDFPYTIRLVSEILESNGSSSMATVCGSALSLLNAGVPIKKSVAGIAMGLITSGDKFIILSDILGEEDHFGDMDFKVTGTEDGITAFQMDIKIESVDYEILKKALEKARKGRLHILSVMNQTIKEPRENISEFAPKIDTINIPPDKIGAVIGQGGKTIKQISEKTETNINIDDSGSVLIYGKDKDKLEEAKNIIKSIIEEPEIGKVYLGRVKRITEFGAFIEYLPGKEGLCHISKLSEKPIRSVHDAVKEGEEIPVRLIEIDKMGRSNLSYIDAIKPIGSSEKYKREASSRRGSSSGRGGRNYHPYPKRR
jgi:polyribonucleotide nucleotidyltransferase